jgi:hypothetical protein
VHFHNQIDRPSIILKAGLGEMRVAPSQEIGPRQC